MIRKEYLQNSVNDVLVALINREETDFPVSKMTKKTQSKLITTLETQVDHLQLHYGHAAKHTSYPLIFQGHSFV